MADSLVITTINSLSSMELDLVGDHHITVLSAAACLIRRAEKFGHGNLSLHVPFQHTIVWLTMRHCWIRTLPQKKKKTPVSTIQYALTDFPLDIRTLIADSMTRLCLWGLVNYETGF